MQGIDNGVSWCEGLCDSESVPNPQRKGTEELSHSLYSLAST